MKQNILFFPSHEPSQFIEIAKNCVKKDPNINPIFFLLDRPTKKPDFAFYTYEDLINEISFGIDLNGDENFGLNLNEAVLMDRHHKKNLDIRSCLNRFRVSFDKFLKIHNIRKIFGYAMSDSIGYIAYMTALKNEVPYFYFCSSRIEDYYYLTSEINGSSQDYLEFELSHPFKNFSDQKVLDLLKEKVTYRKVPTYASDPTMIAGKSIINKLTNLMDLVKNNFFSRNKYLQLFIPVPEAFFLAIRRYFSINELKNYEKKSEYFDNKKFIFFPLHLHPENSTLVWGRWCHNQLEILKLLSRVVPSDVYICVKEHKVAEGRHELGFYKQIASLPNVFLVQADINPHDLISKSQAVATIAGTAGFEAICHGKHVLIFGDADYADYDNAIICTDLSKLRSNVAKALYSTPTKIEDNKKFIRFVRNKLNLSLRIPNYSPYSLDESIIDPMSNLFLNQVK